jgi:two-component system, OmpR family, response regulator
MLNRNILVMDADQAVHRSLEGLLGKDSQRVSSAYDTTGAMERLRRLPFDVILAAQGNNGMDGLKLARAVRSIQPDARIILTGDKGSAGAIRALRAPAYAYFHKPLPEAPLADMVQRALESGPWRQDIRLISARPEWVECTVRCKLDAAERLTSFVREIESDLAGGACEDVTGAFEELLLNAIEHGGGSDPRKKVRVALVRMAHAVAGYIQDPGKGFSIKLLPHAAVCNPDDLPIRHVEIRAAHGQRPGGFGIMMARNLVDELVYNEPGNRVLFVKYLP